MGIKELKTKVFNKLTSIEDKNLLEEVYRLLETGSDDSDLYVLNDDQLKSIAEAKEQIKNGEIVSDVDADKDVDKWINR